MLFDPETANHLKPWLVKTLEPMCVTAHLFIQGEMLICNYML